jgi:predicted esterase
MTAFARAVASDPPEPGPSQNDHGADAASTVARMDHVPAEGLCAHDELGDRVVTTELAGVPAIVHIPARVMRPPIILWHGFGPPANEQALLRAFPLDDVAAIKVYLGLPLFGSRALAGGTDELVRRQKEDMGLLIFKPVVVGAADELPRVIAALEKQSCMRAGDRIGLFGFSAGGAAVLLSLAQRDVAIGAAVLLNPSIGLSASVQAYEHATGLKYAWTPESRALAKRTDATERAAQIAAGNPPPAILVVQGAKDDVVSQASSGELEKALSPRYAHAREGSRFAYRVLNDLPHNLTGTAADDELHRAVSAWFDRYLL